MTILKMEIIKLCISYQTDILSVINTFILLATIWVMLKGYKENTRLNRLQQSENTIIKQIEFHNSLLKGIYINYESTGRGFGYGGNVPENAYGQDAFELLYSILKDNYSKIPGNTYKNEFDIDAEEKRIKDSFTQLYKAHGSLMGNYFKNLYLLIKYINDIKIKDFDRSYYIDLVKSQLSKFEILLLAYDCIWIQDKPIGQNFIELARDNKLLSALETDELIKSVSSVKHIDLFQDRYGISFTQPIGFTN